MQRLRIFDFEDVKLKLTEGAMQAIAREAIVRNALATLAISHPWSPAAQAWLESRGRLRAASAPSAAQARVR